MFLNLAELFLDQVLDLLFGRGKLFSHLRVVFCGGIDEVLEILGRNVIS